MRRGIQQAVDVILKELQSTRKMISTTEEIAQVGTISANGEREIGDLIAKAMEKSWKRRRDNLRGMSPLSFLVFFSFFFVLPCSFSTLSRPKNKN